jgi:hypothetical protein
MLPSFVNSMVFKRNVNSTVIRFLYLHAKTNVLYVCVCVCVGVCNKGYSKLSMLSTGNNVFFWHGKKETPV